MSFNGNYFFFFFFKFLWALKLILSEFFSPKVLRRCGGTVELVDVSTELPQLARRPGLKTWKVSISE